MYVTIKLFNYDAPTAKNIQKWQDPLLTFGLIGLRLGGLRSQDLTQLVFFLWGYVKYTVYSTLDRYLRDLLERVIETN